MNKILNTIKQLIVFCFFLLGMNSLVFAKLPVEKVEKDNAKVLFSQDEKDDEDDDDDADDIEDEDDEDDGEKADSQSEMFEDVITQAKTYHDNLLKTNKALTPRQNLLKSKAEDNAEQAVINRNHVQEIDPLLKEGRYLYNLDASRERGKAVMKKNGQDKKDSELSLASSFSDISHHKLPKKKAKKNDEAKTIAEYKLKAQKLSELKNKKNKDKKKKEEEKDVTYKTQAEALSESFK